MSGAGGSGLAVIAGAGRLPVEIAEAARNAGREVMAVPLAGIADTKAFVGFETCSLGLGQLGTLLRTLRERGIRDVVLIGAIERPDLSSLKADSGLLRHLPRIARALKGGDDGALRVVVDILEASGLVVVGPATVAPDLVASAAIQVGRKPGAAARTDIARGLAYLAATSPFDTGQSVVVEHGRVIAVEAAEGTDAMLARVADLRRAGRLKSTGGFLVKTAKIGQDLRVDMPTIGPATVASVAAASLAGIALGQGEVLVAEKARTLEAARADGLMIAAVPRPVPPAGEAPE